MNTCAPIAIFAFKRLDLLQQTLGVLERCREFSQSPIHLFSDGARENQPGEADAVAKLRSWLRPWCIRRGATLHSAEVNKGLRSSIISGVTAVLEKHDRVIVMEDDLIVSPRFLAFMNEALEGCRDRADIFQVSGYNIPHRNRLSAVGLLRVPACWGWATWRRAWACYSDDAAALLSEVRRRDVRAFNINGSYHYLESLERNAAGTQNTWMVRWYASVFLRAGLTVYPGQSLTRNIGFDGDGTNCGAGTTSRTFMRQRIAPDFPRVDWHGLGTVESPSFAATLEEFYHWQMHEWTKPTLRQRLRARCKRLLMGGPRA
jgi:hypothetical protein